MTDVSIRVENGVGRITLTRPKALHALNFGMCQAILTAIESWRDDASVHIVMLDHEEDTRGFCAGGDIRMLAESGQGDAREARAFFNVEYRMNAAIKAFPKPWLSMMDGVTMGGGVGLSVHGSHAVATERTLFAMPETGIGLFPDVGGGWFLPRLKGELGTWLALTGARLKGMDVAAAGVATHFVPSELIPHLKVLISSADFSFNGAQMLNEILGRPSQPIEKGSFEQHLGMIDKSFGQDTAEEIVASLTTEGSEWAMAQLGVLAQKSPQTVKLALMQLRRGAACATFEENMAMEYRIGWRKVATPEFHEGVRAVIIEKDNAPQWDPATLEEVSLTDIETFFASLGDNELKF